MKRLRVTVEGRVYEVLVEVLDESTSAAPSRAPVPAAHPAAAAASPAHPAPVTAASNNAAPPPVPVSLPVTAAPAGKAAVGAKDITSPLAGKVVSVDVKPGQSVNEGTQVATLEAMKMNTFVFASQTGCVTEIVVHPGDGVEEGAVLVRMA